MKKGEKMNILVIVNPLARNGKTLKNLSKVRKTIEESPHDFIWRVTDTPEEMRTEISNATQNEIHCILLMGGDGTVHEALPAIKQTALPFGLLPCGRGNDFARNIGIPRNLLRNCSLSSDPLFLGLDLPFINDRPFGSIACIGFDAEVNKFAKEKKGYFGGTLGYIICVMRALKAFRPFDVEIRIDDFIWSGRIMMVVISNGPYYGGGMKIAPDALMNDGSFDVCIIQEVSKWELLREFPKVFRGTHTDHPKVLIKSGERVEVNSAEKREIFADGEYIGNIPCVATIGEQRIQVMGVSSGEGLLADSGKKRRIGEDD